MGPCIFVICLHDMRSGVLLHSPGNKAVSLCPVKSQKSLHVVIIVEKHSFKSYIAPPCNGIEMEIVK
jgi:hypothetical protein